MAHGDISLPGEKEAKRAAAGSSASANVAATPTTNPISVGDGPSPVTGPVPSISNLFNHTLTRPTMSPSKFREQVTTQASRFVGDLNPEGIFMEAAASGAADPPSQRGDVGIWFSTPHSTGQPSQFHTSHPPPIIDRFLLPYVKEHCLSAFPPAEDFLKLKNLFLQKIHPLFPVVPIAALSSSQMNPSTIVLRQLVCLAAGSDPEAAQHLRLQNQGPDRLAPQEFSTVLSSSIRAILDTSIIADRVLHIRALTMLSLFTQPTCAEEADLPAQLGARAIHHVQTLGLHLLRYDALDIGDLESLFCAVWALDRINCAIYGRPCLIHERDIGTDLDACIKRRQPCFRLLLSVVQWLDQVVELYRPGPSAKLKDKVAYIDLPVLEAMIVEADALKVPSSLIRTVTAASTLPPPSANARRSLAAERIACAIPMNCLSASPLIPYAVSLALSVEYRKMRHSRLPMFRARAMNAFKRNCALLRRYGDHFWSARVVAGLGERVLKEMERAAATLTKETSPQPTEDGSKTDGSKAVSNNPETPAELDFDFLYGGAAMNSAYGVDNAIDFSLVDAVSGQDVFGHIDPNFNLTAVEDALEANLDIGLPFNWGDWGQYAT
ncbi:hypothetical protein ESCO_003080 [Escovopsis weberi]|uniref:Xylanolytic transcriptional activator regulatory domain-containing protein n=1 Tax=Escovopsis weberi TaxID=150374 RepID=A0A0M8MT98_ESCWE|nr:hypothetical protein ESCO_003080 [Escovopsis weberi]